MTNRYFNLNLRLVTVQKEVQESVTELDRAR